jgi:hypothetical protein
VHPAWRGPPGHVQQNVTAPTLVFNGNDDLHPAFAAEALHEVLPGSRLVPCAWTRDDWMLRFVGRIPESVVELYPRMADMIIDYIREIGSSPAAR